MAGGYKFSPEYQDLTLATLIRHASKLAYAVPCLRPGYFGGVEATLTARVAIAYYEKYGKFPTFTVLAQLAASENQEKEVELTDEGSISSYVKRLEELDTSDWEYVSSTVVEFAREQALLSCIRKSIDLMKEGKTPPQGFGPMFDEARNVGMNLDDLGLVFHQDYEETVDKVTSEAYGVSTGYKILDDIWKLGWKPGWLIVPLAPPKRHKCLGKGTPVMMHDGSSKLVETIREGDLLMGDDGTPRRVITCGNGFGSLYHVEQRNGNNFVCNDAHVMCVMSEDEKRIKEIPASELCERLSHKNFGREWQAYKVGVEFPPQKVPLEPYFLGIWLGDGTKDVPGVTVGFKDGEIADYLHAYANRLGLRLGVTHDEGCDILRFAKKPKAANRINHITESLRQLNVFNNKHVPALYKFNDTASRLELLAGLLDSDGYLAHNKGFIFCNSDPRLIQDVLWLARSVGMRAYARTEKTSIKSIGYVGLTHKVFISGKLSRIPTRLPRKRAKDSKKCDLRCKLKLTPIGDGEWFGFTLDGNERFLLDDFTVTHNTNFSLNLAINMVELGYDVIYYACEISQELAMMRAMSHITSIEMDVAYDSPESFKEAVWESMRRGGRHNKGINGTLLFKSFASKSTTVNDLRVHAKRAINQLGITPRMIVIDYAETMRPVERGMDERDYRQQANIYTDARALGNELNAVVVMPDRVNRESTDAPVPNAQSFQGAIEKGGIVDVALGLCATDAEIQMGIIRVFVVLNRHGPAFQHIRGRVSPAVSRIELEELIEYVPQEKPRGRAERGKFKKTDAFDEAADGER